MMAWGPIAHLPVGNPAMNRHGGDSSTTFEPSTMANRMFNATTDQWPSIAEATAAQLAQYDRSSGLQRLGIAILVVFPAMALVTVGSRVYGRRASKNFGWDDGLIVAAMVLSLVTIAPAYLCKYGAQRGPDT